MPSRKNVLLINPWIYDFTAYDYWLKPLGLLYLASIIRENTACSLSFIDCLDRHHPLLEKKPRMKPDGRGAFPKEEVPKPEPLTRVPRRYSRYGLPVPLFLRELESVSRPDLVLMTCTMTYWYPGVQLVAELVRRKFGQVPIVLGGNYATLVPDHARAFSGADIVIEGPGERKILSLINQTLGDGMANAREFDSLDDLPWPAFDLLRNQEGLPVVTSRGCPFRCSFCAVPVLYPEFEERSAASVVNEIEGHYKGLGTQNFAFFDDALLLNRRRRIIPILEAIIEKNLPLAFHTPNGLHVREIDQDLARLMKLANLRSLFLSQESFDEELLTAACPKVSAGDLEKALAALERAGYGREEVNVYLIVGLPGQDLQAVRESVLRVRAIGARPRLTYFSPVPGTHEWQRLVGQGYLPADADPLLHNKLTFAYLWGNVTPEEFKSLSALLNQGFA